MGAAEVQVLSLTVWLGPGLLHSGTGGDSGGVVSFDFELLGGRRSMHGDTSGSASEFAGLRALPFSESDSKLVSLLLLGRVKE